MNVNTNPVNVNMQFWTSQFNFTSNLIDSNNAGLRPTISAVLYSKLVKAWNTLLPKIGGSTQAVISQVVASTTYYLFYNSSTNILGLATSTSDNTSWNVCTAQDSSPYTICMTSIVDPNPYIVVNSSGILATTDDPTVQYEDSFTATSISGSSTVFAIQPQLSPYTTKAFTIVTSPSVALVLSDVDDPPSAYQQWTFSSFPS